MARDWREKREEEEEKDREFAQNKAQRRGIEPRTPSSQPGAPAQVDLSGNPSGASSEKVKELMDRAEPMIDQVNSLYNQYVSGAEKFPPIARRKQLDEIMDALSKMPKVSPALKFRHQSLHAQYLTFRERWEKMMKKVESGKSRRIA